MRGLVPAMCPTTLLPLIVLRYSRSLRMSEFHYEEYVQYNNRSGAAETRRKVGRIMMPNGLRNS